MYIRNTENYKKITGSSSYDVIYSSGQHVTIEALGGNDSVYNDLGSYASIIGDSGSDTVTNVANYSTVRGGSGDDSIYNGGYKAIIDGGADNDSITSNGTYSSIIGGTGDDVIANKQDHITFVYNAGDGNKDVIFGFNDTSTLRIASGAYTTVKYYDPFLHSIIVKVGNGQITLVQAASLSKLNIIGRQGIYVEGDHENNESNVLLLGNDSSNNIVNHGNNVTIEAQGGNDSISNDAATVTIDGGSGNDSIRNENISVTINGGSGSDTLYNYQSNYVLMNGGADNDSIYDKSWYSTINAGEGNDTIISYESGKDYSINAGSGNDIISVDSSGGSMTVKGSTGNDSIFASSNNSHAILYQYYAGDGNDTINGFNENSTLSIAGAAAFSEKSGNDIIVTVGGSKITLSGAGNLSKVNIIETPMNINNSAANKVVVATNVDDTITNTGEKAMIFAYGGNDTISNTNDDVTLDGGAGNDTLWNDVGGAPAAGKKVSISGGAGNDFISNDGNNSTVQGGADNDTIQNWGESSKINGGDGNDSIYNHSDIGNNSFIEGGEGADTIQNTGSNVTIQAQGGNDLISNLKDGSNSIILSGSGNDSIANGQAQAKLNGEAGNDYIYNDGNTVTIEGGKGSDTIQNNGTSGYGENVIFKYNDGDGNDLIRDFRENSTLSIDGGVYATTTKSGNDIIVTVGDGKITLSGAGKLSKVNIIETPINKNFSESNTTIYGTNANDTIINTGDKVTIQALKGNDSISNSAQNVSIDGGDDNDTISNTGANATLIGGNGAESISNHATNAKIYGGEGNDSLFNNSQKVTISGGNDNDVIENDSDSNNVSIAGEAGNDSIDNEANNVTIAGGAGNDSISSKSTSTSILGGDGNDFINVQGSYKNTINAGKGSDTIKLDWSSNEALIQHSKGDGNDVIEGFNSTSTLQLGDGTQTYSRTDSGTDIIITDEGGEKITLKGAATLSSVHIGGVTNLNLENAKNETVISGDRLNDSIANSGFNVTINTFAGTDTVSNYASKVTMNAGADADYIANNNANRSSISGSDGNDFIKVIGGEKNTITGGAGADSISISSSNEAVIQYNSGDGSDYISGFNESSTLQIDDGKTIYFKSITGGDVIISVGKDEITLAGAATLSTLNIIGEEETIGANIVNNKNNTSIICTDANDTIKNTGKNVTILGNGGRDSIFNNRGDNSLVDGGLGDDTINNKATYATILGGEGNDSIYNGDYGNQLVLDGGAGNDKIKNTGSNNLVIGGEGNDTIDNSDNRDNKNVTINAGAGDDSINNDSPNILFQYNAGDGSDIIQGFNETSTLSIAGGLYSLTKSGNDVIVKVGDGQITLKGAAALDDLNIIGIQDKPASNINNLYSSVSISGGDSKDTITNSGQNVTVLAYGGNDNLSNWATRVTIYGGAGNDSIYNYRSDVTINGGAGDDSICTDSKNISISGDEGNDSIKNYGSNVTISGGAGNDTILNNWNISSNVPYADNDGSNVLFVYNAGDGNDVIKGFKENSTLSIAGGDYTSEKSGNDLILTVGESKTTLKGAATLSTLNIIGEEKISALNIDNTENGILITGTENNDIIKNNGEDVTIQAQDGNDTISNHYAQFVKIVAGNDNDSIFNDANFTTLDGGAGDDTINNTDGFYPSISGAAGNDVLSIYNSSAVTLNGGEGDDTLELDSGNNALIEYKSGDGNDVITDFGADSTLQISGNFSTAKINNDVIVSIGEGKVTLSGAAALDDLNIETVESDTSNSASFVVMDSKVIANYAVRSDYQYNQNFSALNVSSALDNPVKITNSEDSTIKANVAFGTAILSSGNVLEYEQNNIVLASENSGDKITFDEDTSFNYGEIQADVFKGSVLSTKGAKEISFDNNSSAKITAPAGAKININSGMFIVNDLPIKSDNGAGTITVEENGMSFSGYGVQFVDLEVAKESYFGKLTAMTAAYNSNDKSYVIQNTASVKTLSADFTKITFDSSDIGDDKYAYYKVNDVEFLVASDADNINVIEANGTTFKIQGKELDAEKIGRITLDERISFSSTQIDFDGVKVNYALNKPVIYSLDGEEITISDAATLTTGDETKIFKCEAGSYVVNGRSFETSADLTFSANANEIRIPLSDATTEIYFDGVKVSRVQDGGEIVFDLANDKISIPDGAELNITSPQEIKLNLAAGNFTIDEKKISIDSELEITANKESLQVPLSEKPVTVNKAAITGAGEMTIDNTNALFFSILLPDGALVQNTSSNTFELEGKNTSAYFGDTNKKVQLIDDGTAYIEFDNEKGIGVGLNSVMFEHVEIEGVDAWTVETSGASGIDKITGITDGATVSTSTEDIDAGDLRFEVETKGAGEFTIAGEKITTTGDATYVVYGNSDDEIKVSPQGEEYADDDSEAAGKIYNFDKAGDYVVNGIAFHATENTKAQTITRGVEFDLSSGTFQYDGLTLEGSGPAQINRYNAKLVSLTDGAKVSGDNYYNRQFEINGAVELIGKKFETDEQIRCALLNVSDYLEFEIDGEIIKFPFTVSGFIANDKYIQIKDDCYESVKVVGKKISSIEGVKNSAQILGNGLSNISIVTAENGAFMIHGRRYEISDDPDGVEFVTGSHGNVIEINGLQGSVEGDFENEIRVNGKAIRLTGASSVKVTSDGENITEISNVAGDLTDDSTYRKNVRVYELGGAEKLTTSADGIIIFSGNKFKTSAGKTFTLDEAGNVSGLEKLQSDDLISAENVTEDFATMNLSTTDNLDKVAGDFSEGLMVNGVFVKVTDSTNFVVKDDDEDIYIETTAPDTFTINGKTFTTSADKTIFKLDKDGKVSEIVTDNFYPDKEAYKIEGDFNDEIIFNGQKFCVTGTNAASIFLSDESLITIKLARNSVEVVESGGVDEIALSGAGDLTVSGKTFTTAKDFVGTLKTNSIENFIGTIEGKLGGLDLKGITIESDDKFSVTGDGEKVIAIENLQNGSFTCGNLNGLTINGAKISVDNSEEITLTITDGELKINGLTNGANVFSSDEKVKFVTAESGSFFVNGTTLKAKAKDTFIALENSAKVINSSAEEILNMFSGDDAKITVAGSRATVTNYDYKAGEAFITGYENIAEAVEKKSIAYDDGKLTVNSARVTFAEDADSRIINFVDTAGDTQKVGFASDDSKLDASKETGSLILVGGNNSTIAGGAGQNQIYLNGESTVALNGKNTIHNFSDGDKISVSANCDFSFDGSNISVKSGEARALLENISLDAARILTVINGKEIKTAIAQAGEVIATGDELADVYYGEKSGVDFTGFEDSLTVDLSKNFYGINRVTLGGGQNTLLSSSRNETLTSSDGSTKFIFSKDSGRDLIRNFDFDDDKINVGNETITAVNVNSLGGVRMEISGAATLTLEDAQGKNFRINEFTALVDKNLTYNDEANYFVATAQNASVIVNEGAEIWLDGSHGKTFIGDIRTLDASTAEGKTSLAGNDFDNTILAGQGDSTLWGGNGGDDLLIGGAGKNTFFYTIGNGSDTIQGANNGDVVNLAQVTLEQIASSNITADAVTLNFKDGGSLQINGVADVTYQLADGSKYSANHTQSNWIERS